MVSDIMIHKANSFLINSAGQLLCKFKYQLQTTNFQFCASKSDADSQMLIFIFTWYV
jgi:hypothetical protein